MAVSAPLLVILAVQAVPTLLSCLVFTSFSPLLFAASVPFAVLFVALSVLVSVCSWTWSLCDGALPMDANCSSRGNLDFDCPRVGSKLRSRPWWACGEAPRGLQVGAMLFLTWALLFLLLCTPPMANAEIGTLQAGSERVTSLVDGLEILPSSEGAIREPIYKDTNEVEASSQVSGAERRDEDINSGSLPNNAVEERASVQSIVDSGSSDETGPDAHSLAPADGKVELQACRALVRAGALVTCGAPESPALAVGFSDDIQDCSKGTPLSAPEAPLVPPQLDFRARPLYQPQVALLTIMNSCSGSTLSLLAAKSDTREFVVTGFSEKLVAPGGTLTIPVCYLPQYVGAAKGSITIETGVGPLVVQVQGEGLESPYKTRVRVHGKSHYVLSLCNPFNETLFVEAVVVSPFNDADFKEGFSSVETSEGRMKRSSDRVTGSTLDGIVIEAKEGSSRQEGEISSSSSSSSGSRRHKHGLLMRAGETWELPAQTTKDIIDFNVLLAQGEMFRGSFQVRFSGAALEGKEVTLEYPFSSIVSRPSPVTGSSGQTIGVLGGSLAGQRFTKLLLDYKLFMGLFICGLIVSVLILFQVVVHDTELPTISGDLGKGGCHRRSNSRVSPFIKKRDKLLRMWGWGALATVIDGILSAFGSTLWRKNCSTSNSEYNLPRSVTPASPKSSTGGAAGSSGSGSPQAGGRKGSSDRKNNGAAKAEQARIGKGNAETGTGGLHVTTKDPGHHPPSVKQPKSSKFLRSENASTKHSSYVESSVDADGGVVKDESVAAPQEVEPSHTIVPALSPGPVTYSSIKESSKNTNSFASVPETQKPASPRALPVEREKRRRRKKSTRHDVAANLGTMSPASPASPVTPSASAWPVSPPSPEKKSDQSTASLSPRSSGSVDLADAAPLPKLKVKVLHSNPALVASGTDSPRRNVMASTASQQQPRLHGKAAAAEHRKQPLSERGKRSNFSEWIAFSRKKASSTGYNKDVVADGSQSYRVNRHSHRGGHAYGVSEEGPGACFTTSASFPRLNSRQGWANPPYEFGIGDRIDSFDTSVVPPPAIAPALRAPGAKITKQAASEPGWTSLGFTASPELHEGRIDRDLISGAPWHASSSLSGQSSGELVYDIWGNHFGNLSQCSSNPESSSQPGFEKEADPVSGFHRLLVPEHHNPHHSEVLFANANGFAGDMSPTAHALYASFSGFFSEGSTLAMDDSRPSSPMCVRDLPDQLYPSDAPATSKLGFVSGQGPVRPRVRVPYSPPMGCAAPTVFSTSAFSNSSPLSTPTAMSSSMNNNTSCSFWAHDTSKAAERGGSPTLSLT